MSFYLDIDEGTAPLILNTEETGITRVIQNAWDYLSNAVVLWQMIDPEKAVQLERMLNEELQYPPNQAILRLGRNQIERLIGLLQGIETAAVGKIMDKDYHALPGKIDYINEHAPGLAMRTTDGQGNTIYVLDKITEVEWLCAFLETALNLEVDVIQA